MKTGIKLSIVVIAVIVLTSAGWTFICHSSRKAQETLFSSDVISPTQSMIQDIHHDLKQGKCELARAKMQALEKRWNQFKDGGLSPELFSQEIVGMKQ
ncbi:MAG: hypothetical protein EXS18_02365 [Verrucomicrobiae bacterium]|nr:hypothetical protein [Verrucomicrobiae bacterium]